MSLLAEEEYWMHRLSVAVCLGIVMLLVSATALSQRPITADRTPHSTLPKYIASSIDAHRQKVLEWSRSAGFRDGLKYGPYGILAATARDGCGAPERARYMVDLGHMGLTDISKPVHYEMFSLPPLVRYLYMFGTCMSAVQKKELIDGLTAQRRPFFSHGTMNHMILQETSWYLLAQYFPDAVWTDWEEKRWTSPQLMAELKDILQRRHWRSFQSGMNEMLSPTYAFTDLYPILNLVDFAKDNEVAQQAADEAALEVSILKDSSFHGVILPPLTRHNVDQSNAPLLKDWPVNAPIAQQVLWYYLGEPLIGLNDVANRVREPVYLIMLALSSWTPPPEVWSMPHENYELRMCTPDFAKWDSPTFPIAYGDTWVGRDYALATGNFVFDPTGYNDHNQSFAIVFRSQDRRNLIECQQPYWKSNDGENAWTTDFWSPFVKSWLLDKEHAVLLANIPEKDPWTKDWAPKMEDRFWTTRDKHKDALVQLIQFRIPKAVDELVVEDRWIFVRKWTVYIALGSLAGAFEKAQSGLPKIVDDDFMVFKIRRAETAVYVTVDDSGGPFSEFQRKAKAAEPAYNADGPSVSKGSTTVLFVAPTPDPNHPKYWRALPEVRLQGVLQVYKAAPVVDSPGLELSGGILQVRGEKKVIIQGPQRPEGDRYATAF
jgi:hypothetical protein